VIASAVFIGAGIFTLSLTVDKLPPLETMPTVTIPAYIVAGMGSSFLLIVLWRLCTLRVFRAFFSLIAAVLVAYYPAAYACHYWWFNFHEPSLGGRSLEPWEDFIKENWLVVDYGLMAVGIFVGLLFLSLTMDKRSFSEQLPHTGESLGGRPQYIPDRTSAGYAVVLSFFYPGLGQMYNGQFGKGLFVMAMPLMSTLGFCCVVPFMMSAVAQQAQKVVGPDVRVTVVPLISPFILIIAVIVFNFVFYFWNIFDAYQSAEYINETHRRRYGSY
jgi:TM2 domain-containing membrane protein YozV